MLGAAAPLVRLEQRAGRLRRLGDAVYDLLLVACAWGGLGAGPGLLAALLLLEGSFRQLAEPPLPPVLLLQSRPHAWLTGSQIRFRASDHRGRPLRVVLFADELAASDYARLRRLLCWLDRRPTAEAAPRFDSL